MSEGFYTQWLRQHLAAMPPGTTNHLTWFVSLDHLCQEFAAACRRAGRPVLDAATIIRGTTKLFNAKPTYQGRRAVLANVRYYRSNPAVGDIRFG